MRAKKLDSIVKSKPGGSFVLVHADGREEPYSPAASDLAKIDAVTDADIARQIASDPDVAPELTAAQFRGADLMHGDTVIRRGRGRPKLVATKVRVTLRLDGEVIDHYRAGGPGWQSRINAALRKQVELAARRASK